MVNLEGEEYLTAGEACASLGVKAATLYAYVSRGVLPSYRQGIRRRRLYKRHDVEQLLRLRPSVGVPPVVPGTASNGTDVRSWETAERDTGGRSPRREVPRAEDWIPFVN
ncbi:MAG: helix-turn-helix domain-containing protein [Chloroflexota bacterium]|nr:helix-turn-helix domain-containing protein [Chloroflexota bacterium]